MIKNIGKIDRMIRILMSLIISILIVSNVLKGVIAIIFVIFSIILLLTGIMQFCLIYKILNKNTLTKYDNIK